MRHSHRTFLNAVAFACVAGVATAINEDEMRANTTATTFLPEAWIDYQLNACPLDQHFEPNIAIWLVEPEAWSLMPTWDNTTHSASPVDAYWDCGRVTGLRLAHANNGTDHRPFLQTLILQKWFQGFAVAEQAETTPGLTMALWMQPARVDWYVQQPILTLHSDSWTIVHGGCPGYQVQLAQYRGRLLLRYTDGDVARSCRALFVRQVDLTTLAPTDNKNDNFGMVHVVVVVGRGETIVYINGQEVLFGNEQEPVRVYNDWDPTKSQHWQLDLRLRLFGSKYDETARFAGTLAQVAIYNQTLSNAQLAKLYGQGLSPLVVIEKNATNATNVTFDDSAIDNSNNVGTIALALYDPDPVTVPQATIDDNPSVPIPMSTPNVSRPTLRLAMELVSLPMHGHLYRISKERDPTEPSLVGLKHRETLPVDASNVTLHYKPFPATKDNNYFNVPGINAYGVELHLPLETFTYRMVALDADGFAIAASSVTLQKIHVQHVNHAPVLSVPSLVEYYPDDTPGIAVVDGIKVDDPLDWNLNRIRVDVSTIKKVALLSLDLRFRHLADFSSCAGRSESAWQCVGDGVRDQRMAFMAIPDDVALILSNLQYQPFSTTYEPDFILISIFDGQGGDCPSAREHQARDQQLGNTFSTLHAHGCIKRVGSVKVPIALIPPNVVGSTEYGSDLDEFGMADFLFWLLLAMLICALCNCLNHLRYCLVRGTAVEVRDDGDSGDEESHWSNSVESGTGEDDAHSVSPTTVIHETPIDDDDA